MDLKLKLKLSHGVCLICLLFSLPSGNFVSETYTITQSLVSLASLVEAFYAGCYAAHMFLNSYVQGNTDDLVIPP